MAIKNPFKLEKVKIKVADAPPPGKEFICMFNPESYSRNYRSVYSNRQGIGTLGTLPKFLKNRPESLKFTIILEDNPFIGGAALGAVTAGLLGGVGRNIYASVQEFLDVVYVVQGKKHKPNDLIVTWGKMTFTGRLDSVNVSYKSFNRAGIPVRAELEVHFKGTVSDPTGAKVNSSPDLTHFRNVKEGDTLPLLSEEIYKDPHLFIQLAEANNLDHFRKLKIGQKLYFPPIDKEEEP